MRKRVFYISSGRLCAYSYEKGSLGDPVWFGADERGLTDFSVYLESVPNDPVYVLVDFVEEEFREDTIPHVFGRDRRGLIKTKLNRLFRDATYSHALFLGRLDSGRRDDKMLFASLIRPDLLAPWMSQLAKHNVPLAGVYSLALISDLLFKALKIDSGHALIVTAQSGGLRQTFFLDKKLKISRLAVLPSLESDRYASFLLSEVEKIRRYLSSLRHIPNDTPLDVYILGDTGQLEDIRRQSPDSVTTRHHLISLQDAAKAVGIKGEFTQNVAEAVFAQALARRSPANQYAPEPATRYFQLHRARIGLIAASILLLISAVGVSGSNFVEGAIAAKEAESLRRQTAFYDERYRVARARLPETPMESREIKRAVETAEKLISFKTNPRKMLVTLSLALQNFPQLQLDRITWKSSIDPNAPIGAPGNRSAAGRNRISGDASSLSADGETRMLYQLAVIRGQISPFDGNYRRALDLVNGYAEVLRGLPGVHHVRVQSLPLDVDSSSTLQGDAVRSSGTKEANFELRIAIEDRSDEA
ncbi:MAG TPA: hypothetical protein VLS27_09090 [Gammaproteobacteria bacterium]|nr:hypothetical protein [Gammaproteobacteria bacterium]